MTRKLRPLQINDLALLPVGCAGCAFWETAGERERRCGATQDPQLQRDWFDRVADEWGACGRVAYEDDELLGFVKYAPSRYFPQSRTFASAPEDGAVPMISCLHISADARHRGLGTVLLRAALRDLVQRGERRVESFAFAQSGANIDDMPMLGMPFLLRNGFVVTNPHPLYPLMRLELKSLAVFREDLESVLESLRFPLRVPSRAPASFSEER
ncbi:MAG: GNAT family N-acetyltransferase [Coriobacteriia bacterium]|nr:GNAT family N-acetyltransferase [Coriobacteriia bacterium]